MMGDVSRLGRRLVVCALALVAACGPLLTPGSSAAREGEAWTRLPASDLLMAADADWECADSQMSRGREGALVLGPEQDWLGPVNRFGPRLRVAGDFAVRARLAIRGSASTALSLYGIPSRGGAPWWAGIQRLDVGLSEGYLFASRWDGTAEEAADYQHWPLRDDAGESGEIDLEVRRVGDDLALLADGVERGRVAQAGLFPDGLVYLGFGVAPYSALRVVSLSAATAVAWRVGR